MRCPASKATKPICQSYVTGRLSYNKILVSIYSWVLPYFDRKPNRNEAANTTKVYKSFYEKSRLKRRMRCRAPEATKPAPQFSVCYYCFCGIGTCFCCDMLGENVGFLDCGASCDCCTTEGCEWLGDCGASGCSLDDCLSCIF